ncbi:MAG: SUMF1/EgtB/PvdO family nonheme iron enzyme [Thermoguttaceae bacterium]|jgi:formylglycine-generating enzyme required for sulfatase activity|nr:SUMF1/EgtB/PvdO family nonheme iron enzyme [Thermoguttaceae bacterium]
MTDVFDPYYEWLGITPSDQPPHHYRLLGIGLFEENAGVIANAADRQMGHLRGFAAGKHSQLSQKLLNEVAAARVCLLNPEKKVAYDGQLRQALAASAVPVPRAVPVASVPVAAFPAGAQAPSIGTEAELYPADERAALSPVILAITTVAGLVLLGALVWWLSGSGNVQQAEAEPRQPAAAGQATPDPQQELRQPERPADVAQAEPDERQQPRDAADDVPVTPPADDPPSTPAVVPNEEDEQLTEPAGAMPDDPAPEQPTDPRPVVDDLMPGRPPEPEGPAPPSDVPETPAETTPSQPVQAAKRPVPDRAAQEGVRRVLDETYDTSSARPLAERLALVDQLAALAEKSGDAAERFVLLRRASELASEAGEGERMMRLVGQIADEFDVDRLRVEVAMLDGFSKKATSEEQIGALVRSSATVIEEALAAERFDLADSLSAAVYRACQASAGRPFRVEALNRRRRVQQLRTQSDEVQAARTAVQSNPDDEAAHTTLARWHCFVRNDWSQALPHFAKGSEPELRALAERELNSTALDAAGQAELADAWWELAEVSDQQAKPVFLRRAAHWYERAYPELTSTLLKARVTKRLAELEKTGQAASPRQEAGAPPPLAVAPFDAQRAAQHQQAWAKHLNVPVDETNPIGMRMGLIPPGEFLMGTTEEAIQTETQMSVMQADRSFRDRLETESPQHRVRITRPFWMSATEVTQEQYFRVMGVNPSRSQVPNLPVVRVTWLEAAEFCRRLTQASGKKLGDRVYRLPTEAEWEYACRAGSTTRYHFGDEDASLPEHGWFLLNSNRRVQPVATRRPNPWGMFDMHGNVAEWVVDWHSRSYYSESPVDNPMGSSRGWARAVRGGSSDSIAPSCRSASRGTEFPENRSWNVGFRVVLVAADAADKTQLPDAETPSPEPVATEDR